MLRIASTTLKSLEASDYQVPNNCLILTDVYVIKDDIVIPYITTYKCIAKLMEEVNRKRLKKLLGVKVSVKE